MTAYKFGDIVLLGFPHTDLRGVSKRPAIVLYDSGDQDILVARVTTQEYATEADYKISSWEKCGLLASPLRAAGLSNGVKMGFEVAPAFRGQFLVFVIRHFQAVKGGESGTACGRNPFPGNSAIACCTIGIGGGG